MIAMRNPKIFKSEKINILKKLRGLLLRCGNKERTLTYMLGLFKELKQENARSLNLKSHTFSTLKQKRPLDIIYKCLQDLKPAFLLRPLIRSGRRYTLPVPISNNHANFMAINWLRKAAYKDNKNSLSIIQLLAREIGISLQRKGAAYQSLRAYIDIALEQRPFSRFIRKKRQTISLFKGKVIGKKSPKIYRQIKRKKRARYYQSNRVSKFINKHKIRPLVAQSRLPKKRKKFKYKRK